MDGKVFTTHGWIDEGLVYRIETVERDDDDFRVVRSDKFMGASGEWVGNDVTVTVKRTQIDIGAETATL